MLKVLREEKGLTQDELAKKARLTKPYISQLETGVRHTPSLEVLQRLAKALDIPVARLVQEPAKRVQAALVRFDPARVFPLDDPLTMPLLRLMLATDDVRAASLLFVESSQRLRVATGLEHRRATGQYWYALRLLCSHLHEGGDALRRLDHTVSRTRLNALLKGRPPAVAALAVLRRAFESEEREQSIVWKVRNWIGSHYQEQDIRRVFEKYVRRGLIEGAIVAAGASGLSRFAMTDYLAMLLLVDAAGVDVGAGRDAHRLSHVLGDTQITAKEVAEVERFAQVSSEEILRLSDALTTFVDHLLDSVLKKHGEMTAVLGTIEIPPLIRAAKAAVDAGET
jgi:transcriptional regulator with XRE-family HTH domain